MGMQQPFRLILASASPARRYLLERAGYPFDVKPSQIDEPTHAGYPSPRHLVEHVAWLKAAAIAPTVDDGIVLSADTVAWLDGEVLAKPADEADARRILRYLGGRVHELWTGVCLWRRPDDVQLAWQERTLVHFQALNEEQLDEYLRSREWENNAGGYAIKEEGDPYIRIVEGSLTNVIGLPMESLGRVLPSLSAFPFRGVPRPDTLSNSVAMSTMSGRASSRVFTMNSLYPERPWIDANEYRKNRVAASAEYLKPFYGRHVAWSVDGTHILASAEDLGELMKQLDAAGIAGGAFVHDFVEGPDEAPAP